MEESTNNQPLISVVVPSFNHRQFIGKTIETICNQSYEKIQLIIIDDGSTDGSVEYINKLKGKYKNIIEDFVFISQSNIGLTKTLNRALFEYVNGDYITIVASDDYLLEDSLKLRFECLKNTSSDVVFSECIRVDELNNFVGSILFTKERYISLVDLSVRSNFLPAPSAFMKTAVLRKIGGYDESLWFEDLDMWFCLLKSNYKLFFLKKELVCYRNISGSMSDNLEKTYECSCKIMEKHSDVINIKYRQAWVFLSYYRSGGYRLSFNHIKAIKAFLMLLSPKFIYCRFITFGR